jgi:hypothetical protein
MIALVRMSHRRRLRMRGNEFVRRMMEQMRSQRRRLTASPRSRQQLRPQTHQQPMGRSVLVRMMKQLNLQQRRLILSPRLLSKLHDTLDSRSVPRFLFAFVRDCIKGVDLGWWPFGTNASLGLLRQYILWLMQNRQAQHTYLLHG